MVFENLLTPMWMMLIIVKYIKIKMYMKNVKVEDDLWEKLMKLKIDLKKKTVSDVIKGLMKK